MTSHTLSTTLDPRWPFPVPTILLHSMILLPSVAILAMYAPIMASMVSGHYRFYQKGRFADPFVFALVQSLELDIRYIRYCQTDIFTSCVALIFSTTSALYIICSFGAMIYSCLSPAVVMVLSTISTLLWGVAIGLSIVFWQKSRAAICVGDLGQGWRCEYEWITYLCASIAA